MVLLSYLLVFCVQIFLVHAQSDCNLEGNFNCVGGGGLVAIDFGDDEDDDFFAYYAVYNETDSSCSVSQQGTYTEFNQTVNISFTGENCQATNNCTCISTLELIITNNCTTIIGPNGGECNPVLTCEDSFKCPGGEIPVDNPDRNATYNGCGPSSIPITAPDFQFPECCQQHDYCYGTCGSTKLECDNDFYQCMSCQCQVDFTGFLSEGACMTAACSYYQGVDEWGCDSFSSSQSKACICETNNAKGMHAVPNIENPTNKFGIPAKSRRTDEFLCDPPFEAACGSVPSNTFLGILDDLSNETLVIIFAVLGAILILCLICGCGCCLCCYRRRLNSQYNEINAEVSGWSQE